GPDPRGLVLQREEQAALDRGLRGGVVRVPRLAEASRGRADEDERAVAARREPAEEGARGEEGRGQVGGDRLLEAREVELPDGQGLRRIDTRHGPADAPRPE